MAILMSQFAVDIRPLIVRDGRPTQSLMKQSNTFVAQQTKTGREIGCLLLLARRSLSAKRAERSCYGPVA